MVSSGPAFRPDAHEGMESYPRGSTGETRFSGLAGSRDEWLRVWSVPSFSPLFEEGPKGGLIPSYRERARGRNKWPPQSRPCRPARRHSSDVHHSCVIRHSRERASPANSVRSLPLAVLNPFESFSEPRVSFSEPRVSFSEPRASASGPHPQRMRELPRRQAYANADSDSVAGVNRSLTVAALISHSHVIRHSRTGESRLKNKQPSSRIAGYPTNSAPTRNSPPACETLDLITHRRTGRPTDRSN